MSIVTSKANRIIFCEGQPNSPDILFWRRVLLESRHAEADDFRIELKSLGGKTGAASFARGATSHDNWRIIRDRDLDAESETGEVVQWNNGKILLTGQTCLESYFLLPDLLQAFLEQHYPDKLSTFPTDHHATLQETVAALRHYQAARWALQATVKQSQQVKLDNGLNEKDGWIPQSLDRDACRKLAADHVQAFRDNQQIMDLQFFNEQFEAFDVRFSDTDFLRHAYRFWFHGKDIFALWLRSYQNVSHRDFREYAAKQVDWTQFADIVEVQRRCQTI